MNASLNNQFLELYEPLHCSFIKYCRAISGNNTDAEDLVQDTVFSFLINYPNRHR
jgi:DNA-directed RNA polymerase specialized sigma24 family protein